MEEKPHNETNVDWIQYFFADEYHDLKLTEKLSAGNREYHSANSVVLNRDTAYTLDNLSMDATTDQRFQDKVKYLCYYRDTGIDVFLCFEKIT